MHFEALHEPWDALGIDLDLVPGADVRERLRVGPGQAAEVDELGEEALEAGGRDDFQDPGWLIAGVPERMPLVARP